jgi:hypothetical protein
VLEEERRERCLEQRGEHVAVAGQPLELVLREASGRALGEPAAEVELARDDGAARTRDDVRADLGEPPLREVAKALVEGAGDGELEDAVAEELEPLVRRGAVGRPRGVREDGRQALRRELLDQALELGAGFVGLVTDAR